MDGAPLKIDGVARDHAEALRGRDAEDGQHALRTARSA
jgi:hypothetical protein